MNIKIIRADVSHAAAVSAIGKESFGKAFGPYFINKNELQEYLDYTYSLKKVTASIRKENNVYFIAFVDNVAAGFVKIKKHSLTEQIEAGAQMELQRLYVLPVHQGKSIGGLLLNAALDVARELKPDYVWLDTLLTNAKAIKLYEKNGFKKHGKIYFTIGTQTFEYHLMSLPIAVTVASS